MSKIHESISEKDFSNYQGETFKTEVKDLIGVQKLIRKHLYTKPIQTPVQEMLCNALDAMELSGKELEPIKVYLPDLSDGMFKIRDFGPGLTDHQVRDIYANIGVSTKRKNKKAIGCWGYGSKALFAYTSKFWVISFYNGIETTFLAKINSDDSSSFEIIHKAETNEPNGLEIQCPVKDEDVNKFCESIVRCCFFWKVHPIILGDTWKEKAEKLLNEVKTPEISLSLGRAYNLSNELKRIIGIRNDVIVNAGYIPYNLLDSVLEKNEVMELNKNKNLTLVLDYDIEDLQIPPGREFLGDDKKNVDILTERYIHCLTEYEEFFYKKIASYSNLDELQKAALEYSNFLTDYKREFKHKKFTYNNDQYYIDNKFVLKWDCSEYGFLRKKSMEQDISFRSGSKRRTRSVPDFSLESAEKVLELEYNTVIPAVVYVSPMWSDRKKKTTVRKVLENTGKFDSLFPTNEDKKKILYTYKFDNLSMKKEFDNIQIEHIIDSSTIKWPLSPKEKSKILAKICKVDKDRFWFSENTCELEILQDQVVEVFRGSYKSHFKSMSYNEKNGIMEMKKMYKEKHEQELEVFFISSGVAQKLKKQNITFKPLKEEMRKCITDEDILFYQQPIRSIKLPTILSQICNLSFIDKINLPELSLIKNLISKRDELILIEQKYKSKSLPINILNYFGFHPVNKEESCEGESIVEGLKLDYPLFLKIIESSQYWINSESSTKEQEQFIQAWNNAIKDKNGTY